MINIREIKLIEQTCSNNCSAACVAMITGIDINEVMADLDGEPPYLQLATVMKLVRENILPIQSVDLSQAIFISNYINLVTVKSKNEETKLHHVLCGFVDCEFVLFDPAKKNKYNSDEILDDGGVIIDCLRLIDCSN